MTTNSQAKANAATMLSTAIANMPTQDAEALKQSLLEILSSNKPDQPTSDFIWKVLIIGVAIVFVGTAFAIAIGIFLSKTSDALLPLVTIFTTTVGILAPSPFQKGQTAINGQKPDEN